MSIQPNFWLRVQKFIGWQHVYNPIRVEDVPESMEATKLYLVGDGDVPWCAALQCPCGCGAAITLSLIEDDDPHWRVVANRDRTLTMSPSVWRTKGCRSHFFVRRNKVVWAKNARRRAS